MSLSDYKLIGPVTYQGKQGCTDVRCRQSANHDFCMGWHCVYCDAACSYQGHRCDAAEAVLGEAQRIAEPIIKQVSPDRAVITDDDREMCRACGELPATRGMYCRRCDDSIRDEREMRDA